LFIRSNGIWPVTAAVISAARRSFASAIDGLPASSLLSQSTLGMVDWAEWLTGAIFTNSCRHTNRANSLAFIKASFRKRCAPDGCMCR
jgi:hypothetical protein